MKMQPKKFTIKIQYDVVHTEEKDIWAHSESNAIEIALASFYDSHSDKCINPRIIKSQPK